MVNFAALAFCVTACLAQWATFYSFTDGKIYMVLKNNDMVALNFSITGFSDLSLYSSYSESEINYSTGQQVETLSSPPLNSSVFIYDSTMYAFSAQVQDTDYDVCGNGVFQLSQYDSTEDSWVSAGDNLTFSGVSDVSYYAESSYIVGDTSTIYIYGGSCNGTATSRMLSFDMDTLSFSNITTSTKPAAFWGASAIWAPTPQNLLIIGGRANLGWLSMNQLATWNFQSGWLFELTNNDSINSRVGALTLPVFSTLPNNSTSTFSSSYRPSAILVVGGEGSSGDASPLWAQLSLDSNEWTWSTATTDIDVDDILGAAAIFNTLVVINGTSSYKRDTSYLLSLYDMDSDFEAVSDLKESTKTSSTSSSKTTVTMKALVGTLVPLVAIALAALVGVILWKRKEKAENESIMEPLDGYQLGHFRTALDQVYSRLEPVALYHHHNDTGSTLDVASMDSWVKKRQEYDAKRRTLIRHSFLASNETLNHELEDEDEDPEDADAELAPLPTPAPARVAQLQKSFSFSHTPPALPLVKTRKTKLDLGYIDLAELSYSQENIDEAELGSIDEQMDVQVLVSSKRKSVLRVVNPDEEEVRQRTPSK